MDGRISISTVPSMLAFLACLYIFSIALHVVRKNEILMKQQTNYFLTGE